MTQASRKTNIFSKKLKYLKTKQHEDPLALSVEGSIIFTYIAFFLSAFCPPDNFKLEIQFTILSITYTWIAITFSLSKQHINRFLALARSVQGFCLLWISTLFWLLAMLIFHGDELPNLSGVNSGLLGLGALPVAAYIGFHYSSEREGKEGKHIVKIFTLSVTSLLICENLFLAIHRFAGLDASLTYHTTKHLSQYSGLTWDFYPRIFLNIREGNLLALTGVIAFYASKLFELKEKHSITLVKDKSKGAIDSGLTIFLLSLCFLNAFLTQGRALLLAMILPILLSFLIKIFSKCQSQRDDVICVARTFLYAVVIGLLVAQIVDHLAPVQSTLISRSASDLASLSAGGFGGRALIWKQWLIQGFLGSPWIGSGFNFRPMHPGVHPNLSSAHNLLVQILSDAGISGFAFFASWVAVTSSFLAGKAKQFQFIFTGVIGAVLIFSSFSSIFVRPMGIVLLNAFVSIAFIQSKRLSKSSSSERDASDSQNFSPLTDQISTLLSIYLLSTGLFYFFSRV